eukprot:Phypoly_transcript_10659.p1 GENE.Phypoly_transcript_10659~~Phypoly_transcript_10659.p1  ORF type:complete len:385 (+),score=42.90 Phypoly_transcript_10659:53-1156(+)
MRVVLFVLFCFNLILGQPVIPKWDCATLPPAPPAQDINHLRPQDIKAVMTVGDSISAGFAMYAPHATDFANFSSMLVEYRGDVFSIGGNAGYYTLANFLKQYNPNLQGASIGNSLPLDYVKWRDHIIQPFDEKITHLNGAQSGARVEQVPAQLAYIINQLKTTYSKTVDFNNDWKMLTILIGANNLCGACKNESYSQPDFYQQHLETVLEQAYSQIPRLFVNVLLMFNISQVYDCMMTSEYCKIAVNYITTSECGCLTDHSTPQQREAMDITGVAFNQKIYELEAQWAAKNLSTFAVRVQPFLQNLPIAKAGVDFLSKLDCFHPSGEANAAMAIGLWNNLWQPQGKKDTTIPFNVTFICPTEDSYIQ